MRAGLCAHPTLRGTSVSAFACACARRQKLYQRQRYIPQRPGYRGLCIAAPSPHQRNSVHAATVAHRRPAPSSSSSGSFASPSTLLFSRRMAMDTTAAASPRLPQEPRFSPGSDEKTLRRALETLLLPGSTGGSDSGSAAGRWALIAGGEGLERSFRFKTFAKTWDFMTAVALQCKIKNHHPEWSNVYNTTYIRWTTHNPRGLSTKDVELAAICDDLARDFGEVEVEAAEREKESKEDSGSGDKGGSCEMRRLADRGAATAGDCCGPRK